jgi:hypothetical protein
MVANTIVEKVTPHGNRLSREGIMVNVDAKMGRPCKALIDQCMEADTVVEKVTPPWQPPKRGGDHGQC